MRSRTRIRIDSFPVVLFLIIIPLSENKSFRLFDCHNLSHFFWYTLFANSHNDYDWLFLVLIFFSFFDFFFIHIQFVRHTISLVSSEYHPFSGSFSIFTMPTTKQPINQNWSQHSIKYIILFPIRLSREFYLLTIFCNKIPSY